MYAQNKLFTAALILFFFLTSSFWAQSSSWTVEQIANGGASDFAVGPNGDIHMVYEQLTISGKVNNRVYEYDVYYVKKTGDVWETVVAFATPDVRESGPSIDVDEGGTAHVVFTRNGTIYYWKSDTEPWELVAIDNFLNEDIINSYLPDIAVTSDGTVAHIVFTASPTIMNGNLYYTVGNGVEFSEIKNIETENGLWDEGRLGHDASIDIDEKGNIGILFRTVTYDPTPDDAADHISYVSNPNDPLSMPQLVAEHANGVMGYSNCKPLKLINGIAHILYNDDYDLLFTKWDPLTGESLAGYPILVAAGIGSNNASFDYKSSEVVEQPDTLKVAYVGSYNAGSAKKPRWQQEIRYLQLNAGTGAQFSTESIHDGTYPYIVANADGIANISFQNQGNIFYATNTGAQPTPGEEMYASLDVYPEFKGARWNAVAVVTVVDDESDPVSGALVTGHWKGCDCINSTNSAITGTDGTVTLKSEMTKEIGEITFTLNNVEKDGWTYNIPNPPPSGTANGPLGKQIAENEESSIPENYALFNNYPNPFNPTTKIKYSIPEESYVTLNVYDVLGKQIASLVNQRQQPGHYEIDFDASNLSNDVYFYVLRAGEFVESKKMILIK